MAQPMPVSKYDPHTNDLKDKNHTVILTNAQKAFEKNLQPFRIHILKKQSRRNILQHYKAYLWQIYNKYYIKWKKSTKVYSI